MPDLFGPWPWWGLGSDQLIFNFCWRRLLILEVCLRASLIVECLYPLHCSLQSDAKDFQSVKSVQPGTTYLAFLKSWWKTCIENHKQKSLISITETFLAMLSANKASNNMTLFQGQFLLENFLAQMTFLFHNQIRSDRQAPSKIVTTSPVFDSITRIQLVFLEALEVQWRQASFLNFVTSIVVLTPLDWASDITSSRSSSVQPTHDSRTWNRSQFSSKVVGTRVDQKLMDKPGWGIYVPARFADVCEQVENPGRKPVYESKSDEWLKTSK